MTFQRLTEHVWVSGQIGFDDLDALARAGVVVVVNHRPDDEEPGQPAGADLAEAARRRGMRLVAAPVRGLPDAAAVEATARALADLPEGAKALLFCRSGMRSSAAWAMAERLRGVEAETLRAAAAGAGYDLSRLPL